MNRDLHPHQERALEALRLSLGSGKRRPMLQAPTGAGKTILAAAIVERALAKGKQVLFTVPALELVDQTVERFFEEGITDIGVMQGQHVMTNMQRQVQVASVQNPHAPDDPARRSGPRRRGAQVVRVLCRVDGPAGMAAGAVYWLERLTLDERLRQAL
jgi:hypothetical protein